VAAQLDKRGGAIDEKIKKLDEELMKHKEIISRARPGPAQARACVTVCAFAQECVRVPRLTRRCRTCPTRAGRGEAARAARAAPEEAVRASASTRTQHAHTRSPRGPNGNADTPRRTSSPPASYESQRDQLYQQQFNVEQTSFTLASMQDTKMQARTHNTNTHTRSHTRFALSVSLTLRLFSRRQVTAMRAAAKDLKQQFKSKDLDINNIDKLTDEMADLMGVGAEIQDALGRNYAVPDDIDEDELLGELDSLEFELAAEREGGAAEGVPSYLLDTELPSAPIGAPAAGTGLDAGAAAVETRPAATL
jgi:hypothetical protein